jgi:hypothetical protein
MSRGDIVAIPQVGGLHRRYETRESRGHQAYPQSISHRGQAETALLGLAAHVAHPTSSDLMLQELVLEPTIYLMPECDTPEEVAEALHELCGRQLFRPARVASSDPTLRSNTHTVMPSAARVVISDWR